MISTERLEAVVEVCVLFGRDMMGRSIVCIHSYCRYGGPENYDLGGLSSFLLFRKQCVREKFITQPKSRHHRMTRMEPSIIVVLTVCPYSVQL